MKQTIIIHGRVQQDELYDSGSVSPSNNWWIPWFQKQLVLRNEISQALEMPKPYDPVYEDWLHVFKQMNLDTETVLIGHSCGGGFLLRFLSENPDIKVGKVFLIAPWLDPEHELKDFFNFELGTTLADRNSITIFESSDDDQSLLESFKILHAKLPNAVYKSFTDKEHFCTTEFPELLELL